MEPVPFEAAVIGAYPSMDDWMAEVPGTVSRMLHRWGLVAGHAYAGGANASVLQVRRDNGDTAVLKVAFPHPEGIWEAVGLQAFPTDCAPRIIAQDPWTWSTVMEAVIPGHTLADSAADSRSTRHALERAGRLHVRLRRAPAPTALPRLADAMHDYAATGRGNFPHQRRQLAALEVEALVAGAIDELEVLAAGDGPSTLLHGDFNPGNLLDAGTGGWMVVDPKPMVGDPAYDLWPMASQLGQPFRAADPAAALAENLRVIADAAEVDFSRAARWARARTGLNVSWFLAEGDTQRAAAEATALMAWSEVVGS